MSARANQSVDRRRKKKKKETVAIQYLDGCARLGKEERRRKKKERNRCDTRPVRDIVTAR